MTFFCVFTHFLSVVSLIYHSPNAAKITLLALSTAEVSSVERYISVVFFGVMAEVLRDLKNAGRCYVKYEIKQACFHITARKQ